MYLKNLAFMKSVLFSSLFLISSVIAIAQTPIDALQKQNLEYLKSQESDGYEFRSQIITEFDQEHASQDVNIKLSKDYTYIIVAMGDRNIPKVTLEIKPAKNAKIDNNGQNQKMSGQSIKLMPTKSGRFKISIKAADLGASKNGFISFMVLRK